MDSFNLLLDMARSDVPIQRRHIRGGLTNGRLVSRQGPTKKNALVNRPYQGQAYARLFRDDDDEIDEDFETMGRVVLKMRNGLALNAIDDLTSSGTHDHENLLDPANLDVYGKYKFERHPDCPSASLLIHEFKDTILEHISCYPTVIIKGPTGCGKSTQVPQYIFDEARGHGIHCNIIITQPRKIAAIKLAERVCDERDWKIGTLVGYQVSLERTATNDTRITFCTAGVLLQKLINRPNLSEFTHIIIDEVHERDSETDFLLIVIKKLMRVHGNRTKLILMSATLTADKFAAYFTRKINGERKEPPIVELPHTSKYQVLTYYLDSIVEKLCQIKSEVKIEEPTIDSQLYGVASMLVGVFHSIDSKDHSNDPGFLGAVLIFLPGIAEIDYMYSELQKRNDEARKSRAQNFEDWMLCPMHSTMSYNEQRKVFMRPPEGTRKIILATNIAESSITVPDVKYVIDFCLTKRQVQDNDTFYSSLQLSWVSKSQATQRSGRVGRTMPGRVYRFVPRLVYEEFDDDCDPEILRCPLDVLVLKAKELDMGPPIAILGSAIDPPDLTNVQRTILNLKETGALTLKVNGLYDEEDGELTFIGKVMAALPLDIQLSKLILVGHMVSMLRECVTMACCMSGRHIFANPLREKMKAYDNKIALSKDSKSDPITFYSLYTMWRTLHKEGRFKRSGGQTEEEWANRFFVQVKSLNEVFRLEEEILKRLDNLGIRDEKLELVKRDENMQALLLRIAIAGAFYPNYFVHVPVDEKNAVRVLGNRDPFRSVYLTKFPQPKQPGPLYRDTIRQLLKNCGSGIKVQFDTSSKVYIEFENSVQYRNGDREPAGVPGKIMKAVYRAVKMRQLGIPMTIPLLPSQEARRRAAAIFGEDNWHTYSLAEKDKAQSKPVASVLPGLSVKYVRLVLTYIVDPSNFFASCYNQTTGLWIHSEINNEFNLVDLDPRSIKLDMRCVAAYSSDNDAPQYYRAKVLRLDGHRAEVFYIDYGNTDWVEYSLIKGYGAALIEKGIHSEPSQCIPCRLAEIQPVAFSNVKSQWDQRAINNFRAYFRSHRADAQIYSIVNGVMAVYLFPAAPNGRMYELAQEESFNHLLVAHNFAQLMEEPYLSKENHALREKANALPGDPGSSVPFNLLIDNKQLYLDNVEFEAPTWEDTKLRHTLGGPFSPLEMSVAAMTRKCAEKSASVDQNSVNSVLLDNNPMDSSSRLIVAGTVHQSPGGERLTLRNTTIMPSIRGIVGLMCLIFAPYSELRVDSERTHFTGALCGLGFDEETGRSYDQENDVEVSFDCKFDLDDILDVNIIRYKMNDILCGDSASSLHHSTSKAKAIEGQKRIIELIQKLLTNTKRPPLNPHCNIYANKYEWDQIPEEYRREPTFGGGRDRVFPLICGVDLVQLSEKESLEKLRRNLYKLHRYSKGLEPIPSAVSCDLCQKYLEKEIDINHHLVSWLHQDRVRQAFGCDPLKEKPRRKK